MDYTADTGKYINEMYDAQKESKLRSLENAYNSNVQTAQDAADKVGKTYNDSANALGANYEVTRANTNRQAAMNGLNTGTGSQIELAQGNAYQNNMADLRRAQAEAQGQADRAVDNIKMQYQTDVANALNANDAERAAALLGEYKQNYANQLSQAANLAKYGDFSGYRGIYDEQQITNMQRAWAAQNPDLAYNTQQISADDYRNLTGYYPKGYTPYSGGGNKPVKPEPETPVDTEKFTSSQALNLIENNPRTAGTAEGRIAGIEAMYEAGNIDKKQRNDLIYAIKNSSK